MIGMIVFLSLLALSLPRTAHAQDDPDDITFRVSAGVRSLALTEALAIPTTLNITASVDFLKYFRVQLDLAPYDFLQWVDKMLRVSLSAGAAFQVLGENASRNGGWEIAIPVLAEFGYLRADTPNFDDEDDELKWLLLGPSTGADFTRWSKSSVGFVISLKVAYLFRVGDIDSYYVSEEYFEEKVGYFDAALLFGVAF